MYHAEKIIDGVLHWKGMPNSPWKPYSHEQLTNMLVKEREAHRKTTEKNEIINKM